MGKKTQAQKQQRKKRTLLLYSLITRSILFIFLLVLTVFILYLTGNFRSFLDSTQRYLLKVCSVSCVMQGILCIFGLVLSITMFAVTLNAKYWLHFFIDLILLALAVAGFVLMYAVAFVSSGI